MINIIIEDKTIPVKNLVTEFTMGEFERVTSIINNEELSSLTRWSKILTYLGVPTDLVDNFDTFDFINIIKEFNSHSGIHYDYEEILNISGNEYRLNLVNGELRLTVKEMRIIEDFMSKDKTNFSNVLAVIYKRDDIQKELQYDPAHIKYKSELISKEVTAHVALPIIGFLTKKLSKDVDVINGN